MDIITINSDSTTTVEVDLSGDVIVINPVAESAADLLVLIAQNSENIDDLQELHSTSWISGAVLSINTDLSKFDVTAGTGQHVDHSTHPPIITPVTIAAQTAISVPDIATQTITEVAIDKNGNMVFQFKFTSEERRDYFSIGALSHPDLATINNAQNLARVIDHEVVLSISDLALAVGSLAVDGMVVQPNGANLNIDISAGTTYVIGINKGSIKDPNYTHSNAISAPTFFRAWQDGSGGFNIKPSTTIDPDTYDDGTGGLTEPNGAMLPNKWQLFRVYYFPVDGPRVSEMVIHYGTATFGTAEEALSDLGIDFTPHPVTANAVHRANIAVKSGSTDLSDTTQAIMQTVGKFGHVGGGGAAGSSTTDHELLSNLLGGATNDHQHLTTAELAHLNGIEAGATTDQSKAEIDALGIDAETIDGLDSTDLEQVTNKDATGGYTGLTLFKINFKNALNTFTSFFTNANTAARTYTFQNRDGTIADDTDITGREPADAAIQTHLSNLTKHRLIDDVGTTTTVLLSASKVLSLLADKEAANVDILKADETDELTVGYTTSVEVLASDTITPDFTKEGIQTRAVAGNITINNPSSGQGVMHIIFTIDGSARTVTYGSEVKPVVDAPTSLTASKIYIMTLVRDTATHTIASILEVA